MDDYVYVYGGKELVYQPITAPSRPERRRPFERVLRAAVAAMQFYLWLRGI